MLEPEITLHHFIIQLHVKGILLKQMAEKISRHAYKKCNDLENVSS